MITLNIQTSSQKPRIAVVGCLHGNEVIGRHVLEAVSRRLNDFHNLMVVVANTDAYHRQERFIDQDLNRSFPGNPQGNIEERLAAELLSLVVGADYLIDLHTTTSPGFPAAAISGSLTPGRKRLLQALDVAEVAVMEQQLLDASLIGHAKNGISLEYGLEAASQSSTIDSILAGILRLQNAQPSSRRTTTTYTVSGIIPKDTHTETELRNLVFSSELDGYPFILDEANYPAMRGFLLKDKQSIDL